MNLIDMIQVKA